MFYRCLKFLYVYYDFLVKYEALMKVAIAMQHPMVCSRSLKEITNLQETRNK